MTATGNNPRLLALALLSAPLLCLAGCNDGSGDPTAQIGPNPVLPDIQQYLMPPMHIARVVGWKTRTRRLPSPRGLRFTRSQPACNTRASPTCFRTATC